MSIASHVNWPAYDTFLIMSHSGWLIYDPNQLRPNPNLLKLMLCLQVRSNIDAPNFIQWVSHFSIMAKDMANHNKLPC